MGGPPDRMKIRPTDEGWDPRYLEGEPPPSLVTLAQRGVAGLPFLQPGALLHLSPAPPAPGVWLAYWHFPWAKSCPMPTAGSCHVDCGCS